MQAAVSSEEQEQKEGLPVGAALLYCLYLILFSGTCSLSSCSRYRTGHKALSLHIPYRTADICRRP